MRGFTLISVGSRYYGEWAYNIARSLRFFLPDCLIQVIYEKDAVSKIDMGIFDIKTEVKTEHCRRNGFLSPGFLKLNLYEYIPKEWEACLYLDVDGLCVSNPIDLLNMDIDYGIQTNGTTTEGSGVYSGMQWMELAKMRNAFGLEKNDPIPGTNSSIQFIKVCEYTEQIFIDALCNYFLFESKMSRKDLLLKWGRKKINQQLPDELFLNSVLAKRKDYSIGQPIYFNLKSSPNFVGEEEVRKNYKFIGLFGNESFMSKGIKNMYKSELVAMGMKQDLDKLIKNKFVNFN